MLLKTLQKHGVIITDLGSAGIYFESERDDHTELKWKDVYPSSEGLARLTAPHWKGKTPPLSLDDFEVVDPQWQFDQYLNYERLKP